jgi:hypothetical protein
MTAARQMALTVALAWIGLVVVQRGLATGAWADLLLDTTALMALTALLAVVAAIVDEWVEESLRGSGGVR